MQIKGERGGVVHRCIREGRCYGFFGLEISSFGTFGVLEIFWQMFLGRKIFKGAFLWLLDEKHTLRFLILCQIIATCK